MPSAQRGRKRPLAETSLHQYKLCGFLHVVFSVKTSNPPLTTPLVGSSCSFDSESADLYLRTDDGTTLVPIEDSDNSSLQETPLDCENPNAVTPDARGGCVVECGNASNASGKKRRRLGLVNGSRSVVRQLRSLTSKNRMEAKGLVVGVSKRGQELRAVVLLDVYLPLALWSDHSSGSPA